MTTNPTVVQPPHPHPPVAAGLSQTAALWQQILADFERAAVRT